MIDDATLRKMEAENIACGDTENEWIIRTARRYLALRKNCGVFMMSDGSGCNKSCLDAVADRLLEGGE